MKHSGDLSFETILKIAKAMRHRSLARKMEGTVKEILGKFCHKKAQKLNLWPKITD